MNYIGKQVKVTMEFGESVSGKVINQEGAMLMVDTELYDVRVFTDKDTVEVVTEEETKMDELKVYTGKDTIEALLDGKVLQNGTATQYKLDKGKLMADYKDNKGFVESLLLFNSLITFKLTEVVTPQVGDWVRVSIMDRKHTYTAQITSIVDNRMYAKWCDTDDGYFKVSDVDWEILSPEKVSEYKREQAFVKVGRKLNEFKPDDIVYVESLGEMAIVVSNMNDQEVRLHKVNIRAGLTAKPHQLTPIAFTEQQVDLS